MKTLQQIRDERNGVARGAVRAMTMADVEITQVVDGEVALLDDLRRRYPARRVPLAERSGPQACSKCGAVREVLDLWGGICNPQRVRCEGL